MKNIEFSSDYENSDVWIGGLAGRTISDRIEIKNSSISNFKVYQNKEISSIVLGGMIGETTYSMQIENSYVQNIDFNISNTQRYNGIGGIVGKASSGTEFIKNCYVTGNIDAKGEYIGGIVGRNKGAINNCYSGVNINSTSEYIGGIAGEDTSTISNQIMHNVRNNIYLGNIYTSSSKKEYINRIFGTTNNTTVSNYAYSNQLINGYVSEEEQLATLLTRDELLQENTYTNIGFDNNWDYSGLSEGILPKLYNTNGKDLLPNQEDNRLEEQAEIRIDSVEANKKDVNHAEIRIVINNPAEEKIKNIEIESMDVTIERNVTQEGKTYIDILGTAIEYYDSYKITGVVYEQNGEEKKVEEEKKIELQFFKDIGRIEDWQEIDSYSAQNYRLVADLDFSNIREPNTNVSIGRLVAEGNGYTIKNLTTNNKNLIKEAKLEIRNITFENINVTNDSSNVSIIAQNNATIENLTFKDCTIQSKGSYVGIISNNISQNISGINLENIKCFGNFYVGGFIANTNDGVFSNINAKNIVIEATGDNVGGIFGYISIGDGTQKTEIENIEISNANIKSTGSRVGGIAGHGRLSESKVANTVVEGLDKVGGMIGEDTSDPYSWTIRRENTCEDVTIKGRNEVGGVYGYGCTYDQNIFLINSQVIATGNMVGGIIGNATAHVEISGVVDSKISGNNQVGGIFGVNNNNTSERYYFIENSEIEGYDQVGGIDGCKTKGNNMNYMYSNAKVIAINGTAGGIIGYYNNLNSSQADNISSFSQVMLQGTRITGTENVGGFIGKLDKEFVFATSGAYNSYYVDAKLNGSNIDTISLGFGNFDYQTDNLGMFVYKYSSINGQYVENVKDLDESQIVIGEQLREEKTYTDKGFTTTYFDFSMLTQDKYPILVGVENQGGIDLPIDPEESGIALFINEIPDEVEKSISNEDLPNIAVYAVDVDKINIDFDNLLEGTNFNYTVNGEKSENIPIENKTYTFSYDFKTPIEIELTNGGNSKIVIINPDDIRRKLSYVGDNWMYLDGNTVILNGNSISGEYVNLYSGKGLTIDGKVLDIVSGKEESNISEISLVETKAISEYNYNGTEIKTFGTYSLVGNKVRNQIYEVKNGKLSVISSNVQRKIGDNVIDFYNENEYQTILASDGILYDLKEPLKYPSNFENSNISEISVESDKKEVLVYYDNGSIIIFNYMTGEEIYKTSPKEKVSLFAYIGEKLTSPDELYTDLTEEYKESKELEEKLIEEPIELYLGSSETNNAENRFESNNSNESYVTVYNAESDKYEVYKESELLDESIDNPESETSKIEKVKGLTDYYYSGSKVVEKDKGLVYIGISIIALGIAIVILHRLVIIKGKNKKKV